MLDSVKRFAILDFGLFYVHGNGTATDQGRLIGIPGYLIQTAEGKNILVDTGFHPKYAIDADKATKEDQLESFGRIERLTAENLPSAQLAKCGLTMADIDLLIMTHTDIDHVGGIGDFPGVPIVIHTDERAFDRPRYWNSQPLEWPEAEYRLIEEDTELMAGLTLLTTSGHAPGHLSILLTLPELGAVLLTCDAIGRPAELALGGFAGSWDVAQAEASGAKLMGIAERENAFVIYGHDPEQWGSLKKAPEWYV